MLYAYIGKHSLHLIPYKYNVRLLMEIFGNFSFEITETGPECKFILFNFYEKWIQLIISTKLGSEFCLRTNWSNNCRTRLVTPHFPIKSIIIQSASFHNTVAMCYTGWRPICIISFLERAFFSPRSNCTHFCFIILNDAVIIVVWALLNDCVMHSHSSMEIFAKNSI